jgi:hypothetical protein
MNMHRTSITVPAVAARVKPQGVGIMPSPDLPLSISWHNAAANQPPSKIDSRVSAVLFGVPRGRKKGV